MKESLNSPSSAEQVSAPLAALVNGDRGDDGVRQREEHALNLRRVLHAAVGE